MACATGLVNRGALSTSGFVGLGTATRRGPLIVEKDFAWSTVLVLEIGLNLGSSGISTRRGPLPGTGPLLNGDTGSVLLTSLTDLVTSRVFFPINREPSSGGGCRTVDRDIGMIGAAGTLDVRLELFVAVVEVDIRGMSLLRLTILSAGTGGGGGCKLRPEEFGVDNFFGSLTSGDDIDCATNPSWSDSRAGSFIRLNIDLRGT